MAEALTNWEVANGLSDAYDRAGAPFNEVVENFVEAVLETATQSGKLPDPAKILPTIPVFARFRNRPLKDRASRD
jgi:hypothetical protein